MSTYASSERKSSTPSILKKPDRRRVTVPGHVVRFDVDTNLKSVLKNFQVQKNKEPFLDFVCHLRDIGLNIKDDELLQLVSDARECMPMLNENAKLLVQVVLILKWAHRSDEVVSEYQHFVLDVCSAYNYYTRFAVQQLIQQFLEVRENCFRIDDEVIPEEEERMFNNIHYVLRSLLKIVPMSVDVLLDVIKKKFPFKKDTVCYLNYVHNALLISSYAPVLKQDILSLIINKLVHLDVATPKELILQQLENEEDISNEDMFSMEVDSEIKEYNTAAKTLDLCLIKVYEYMRTECHDKNGHFRTEKATSMFNIMTKIFEDVVLPTHASSHVQFVFFYFFSFKLSLVDSFISFLWHKITDPNVACVIRQASLCYLSSLLARANYISVVTVKNVIRDLTAWIHKYIDSDNDERKYEDRSPLVRIHGVFYSACHALFYLIAFRHQELFNGRKSIRYFENLNLGRIITCRYSPLSVCNSTVVEHFKNVMHIHQLAYCSPLVSSPTTSPVCYTSSIISEHNDSSSQIGVHNWPDEFFPFDMYLLKKSSKMIAPLFREYEDPEFSNVVSSSHLSQKSVNADDDEFIPSGISPRVPSANGFSPVSSYPMMRGF